MDVRGGIRFTYKMDLEKLTPKQREDLVGVKARLLSILQNRAVGPLGVSEPTVSAKGADQFVIELPGLTDIETARQVIGTSAKIKFYHAKNVVTPKNEYRTYIASDSAKNDENPAVSFQRKVGGTGEIKPGTPEYAAVIAGWDMILQGDELASAELHVQNGSTIPAMNFSSEGARKMEAWTRKVYNRRENLAAVLDGKVLSIASVMDDTILKDNAIITGTFTTKYVQRLVDLLNAGALPVDLVPLSSEKVDPTIGNSALEKMVFAGAIAFSVIAVFLIAYYAFPGLVALVALLLYILFTLTVLKLINATFSLAAIAGFILSVGMAVDANILVFERFKEEMKRGRTLTTALELGFRRALPAIIDSNACTILTSLVLANLGTGPVKGFATTLIIGVLISLFTAVFVTRSLLMFLVGSGIGDNPKWYAVNRSWFGERFEDTANEKPFEIMQKSKRWFGISILTVVVGLPFIFMGGLKPNVEFLGGSEAVFSLQGSQLDGNTIRESLEKNGFKGVNVKLGTFEPQDLAVTLSKSTELAPLDEKAQLAKIAEIAGLGTATPRGVKELPADEAGQMPKLVLTYDNEGSRLSTIEVVRKLQDGGFASAQAQLVKAGDAQRSVYITIPPTERISSLKSDNEKIKLVSDAVGLDASKIKGFTEIGPSVQQETITNAVMAVLVSSGLIIVYLAIRFGISLGGFLPGLRFGFSAIGALVHDILVVIGVTAAVGYFYGWEVSALFITSMLTVIGFSVHDTIVIFDRIRENLRKQLPGEDFAHLVNRSVTQSFGRSLNTSATVIVTLGILIAVGTATPDLKLFCVTMLAGIISGTYSSIYNASPILYLWDKAVAKSKGEQFTLLGLAEQEAERSKIIAQRVDGTPLGATPAGPTTPASSTSKNYGQVRRKSTNPVKKPKPDIDDDL
ncbi:MAG: protein translocase subunit SecD [Fimbriimonas sp.]